ncbi:hypothetical protein F4679DRAFT_321201 [Xylaria curta]|nr:hypothetical protein F4679DRAFT_321201 [Xylaria curta]
MPLPYASYSPWEWAIRFTLNNYPYQLRKLLFAAFVQKYIGIYCSSFIFHYLPLLLVSCDWFLVIALHIHTSPCHIILFFYAILSFNILISLRTLSYALR